jgi:thioredoxin reductase (NADPH)
MYTDYDVIIIGSGCAGLAAALYTTRAGFSTLILEKEIMGGELMNRQLVENYPGFAEGVQGPELGSAMVEQAMNAGTEFEIGAVTGIESHEEFKVVNTEDQNYTCKGVIIATGAHPRKLSVPGEDEFSGKGVFYCATCDGPEFAGKTLAVAGAGDSGVDDGLNLQSLGCSVKIIEIMPQPKATKVLLDRAYANPNMEIKLSTKIEAILGDEKVTGVEIQDVATGEKSRLDVEGLLVCIGLIPNTQFVQGLLTLTPTGQIPVTENMETSIPGICAAGDIREHSPMQFATAVGDGVTAAMALGRYLRSQ